MKKMIVIAMLAVASFANAAEVNLLAADIGYVDSFNSNVDARFYIDTDSGQGFAKVAVTESRIVYDNFPHPYPGPVRCDPFGCYPGPHHRPMPTTMTRTVFEKTVKIEGLMMMGKQVVYQGAEGNVDCGKMGVSRVFKKPTFFLSGNCNLDGRLISTHTGNKVIVNFKTK